MMRCKRKRDVHASHGNEEQQGKCQEENQNPEIKGFKLLDLPSFIIMEILTRISTKDILYCRCVCKSVRGFISDPYFAKSFLAKSPFTSIVFFWGYHINFLKLGGDLEFSRGYKNLKPVYTPFVPNEVEIVGCCNGIICLWDKVSVNILYISNPVLGEFAALPNPLRDKYVVIKETYCFGFNPATSHYKVIKFMVRRALLLTNPRKFYRKSEVQVLVVGTNTWTYVGDAPFPLYGKICHVMLNGRFHWMVDDNNLQGPLSLHSFDIGEEQAHPIPAPPGLRNENLSLALGMLGNCLCVFDSRHRTHVEIWSMKEYGVATSWTKDCISTTSIRGPSLRPVTLWKDGEIIMSCHRGPLVSYDPKEGKFTKIYDSRHKFSRPVEVVIYTPSFLSLKHVSVGACLKIRNVKSYFAARLG